MQHIDPLTGSTMHHASPYAALPPVLIAYSVNAIPAMRHLHRQTTTRKHDFCVMLQLLQTASQHVALQAEAIELVLAASIKQEAVGSSLGMTARSRDLLALLKQSVGIQWPASLQPATASLLAQALLHEPSQPDVTYLFETRTAASLVIPAPTARMVHTGGAKPNSLPSLPLALKPKGSVVYP